MVDRLHENNETVDKAVLSSLVGKALPLRHVRVPQQSDSSSIRALRPGVFGGVHPRRRPDPQTHVRPDVIDQEVIRLDGFYVQSTRPYHTYIVSRCFYRCKCLSSRTRRQQGGWRPHPNEQLSRWPWVSINSNRQRSESQKSASFECNYVVSHPLSTS